IEDLSVEIFSGETVQRAVNNISCSILKGETLALGGESGSGKSGTAHSILRLLPYPLARHPSGTIMYQGEALRAATPEQRRHERGNRTAMTFQAPMSSLNPLHTIEKQINEILILHKGMNAKQASVRTLELLKLVEIPNPAQRMNAYPHELSGGQRQRVMIAMAL